MTFNGSWGYLPYGAESDWRSTREVIGMLRTATAGQGNLLLNIGPKPDGSVPDEAPPRLQAVGRWLERHGEAVYGQVARADHFEWMPLGQWTRRGNTAYFWCSRWPGKEIAIGGFHGKVTQASIIGDPTPVTVVQRGERLWLRDLPAACPDPLAGIAIIKLECASEPRQQLGAGCVSL
jgi:alpha-L-fucosidase